MTNKLPDGVMEVICAFGEKRYQALNETQAMTYSTPAEAARRYRAIDSYSKAVGRTR